ncbi:MAG: MltA domain-containing protein [Desulfovibrionaceae bacterium]
MIICHRYIITFIKQNIYHIRMIFIITLLFLFTSCTNDVLKEDEKNEPVQEEEKKEKSVVTYTLASKEESLHASAMLSPKSQGIDSFMDYEVPLQRSINWLKNRKTSSLALDLDSLNVTWGEVLATAELLLQLLPQLDKNPELLVQYFNWYKPKPTMLFTGYYEPLLKASRKHSKKYKYPIYATPSDMKVLQLGNFHPSLAGKRIIYRMQNSIPVPYHARKDIDSFGALRGKGLELAWTDSLVDIFFVQIQGSGRLLFEDGSQSYLLYASQTGREYISLGKIMGEKGLLDKDNINMFTIREWLEKNPGSISDLLNTNPSYVFFREATDGPFGSIAQKLTPWQSIAVDKTTIPYGGVVVMDISLSQKMNIIPEGAVKSRSISGFGFAQDTGGAIRGSRVDLFCGPGDIAEDVAGLLAGSNPLWLLLKKKQVQPF